MLDFHFSKHALFNLPDERLERLETYIHRRTAQLISLLEHNFNEFEAAEQIETRNIRGTFRGHVYQLVGNENRGGQLIVMNRQSEDVAYLEITAERFIQATRIEFIEEYIRNLALEDEIWR